MVTTFYPPYHFGGDAVYVYRLVNALARRGHHVTVVHAVDAYRLLRSSEPRDGFPHERGVEVIPVESRFGRAAPALTYLTGRPALIKRPLEDVLVPERFDVIHFHNVSLIGGPGVLSYGEGTKLYTMHEHWLVCPMHVLWKNNREPCIEPQCLRCTLAFHRPPQPWRYTGLLDRQLEHVQTFIAPSRFTLAEHRRRGFTRPIRHLPYFVPETTASGRREHERPYFLYVGRLVKSKGVDVLIDRFRTYSKADLLIAGDGDERRSLQEYAAGLQHVHFLGHVHEAELGALYRDAIALLVPSVGYEVFPLVVLESFTQRTPVIVNDLGGLPEMVADSRGGHTYRTQDELLAAMDELLEQPGRRRELGENGHRAWQRLWSEDRHLESYFGLVDSARR